MPPKLPSSLGLPVSTREFSFFEMVARAWGSEFFAPDHRVYQFGGVRFFDSTDLGFTGFYSPGQGQVSSFSLSVANNPINATAMNLTWTLATIYADEIDFYNIMRSVNGGPFTLLVSINAIPAGFQPNYIDSNLIPTDTYSYFVFAIADVGSTPGGGAAGPSGGGSNTVTVGPATPPVLSGTLIGTTEIDLTWTASTVPDSTIQNYLLYRQVDGGGFSPLTTTAGDVLAFNDLTVSIGHTYDYYVVARPVLGFQSIPSNVVTETIAGSIDALIDLAFISTSRVVGITSTGNAAWSSDGGVTTNPVPTPLPNIDQFSVIQGGNGIAVALGQDPDLGARLVTTTDGVTWTDTTPVGAVSMFGIYFSPMLNTFIAWDGGSTNIYMSANGIAWTLHHGNHGLATFTSSNFVETDGVLYVGEQGTTADQVWKTVDGITYSVSLALSVNARGCIGPVLNGTVLAAAPITSLFQTNDVWTSPDGTTWTKKSNSASFFTTPPYPVIQVFGGLFVTGVQLFGDGKTIATSPDCVTWTNHTPTPVGLNAISQPAIRATTSGLYVFGLGCAHTPDYSSWTLDVSVDQTVNNVKQNTTAIVGCGADAIGNAKFFKLAVGSIWTGYTSGQTTSTGIYGSACVGYWTVQFGFDSGGAGGGAIPVPIDANIQGAQVVCLAYGGFIPMLLDDGIVVAVQGNVPQNAFTSVSFVDNLGHTEVFTSASAVYTQVQPTGYSVWAWPPILANPFDLGGPSTLVTLT